MVTVDPSNSDEQRIALQSIDYDTFNRYDTIFIGGSREALNSPCRIVLEADEERGVRCDCPKGKP
jgi:hypothetical protein